MANIDQKTVVVHITTTHSPRVVVWQRLNYGSENQFQAKSVVGLACGKARRHGALLRSVTGGISS